MMRLVFSAMVGTPVIFSTALLSTAILSTVQAAEPKLLAEFSTDGIDVRRLEFSPDGKYLAVVAVGPQHQPGLRNFLKTGRIHHYEPPEQSLRVWDIERRKLLLELDEDADRQFGFSPNGKHLACADDHSADLRLWDLTATPARPIRELDWDHPPRGFEIRTRSATFSPDGKLLVSGGSGARLWKPVATGGPQEFVGQKQNCFAMAFDGTGRRLAFTMSDSHSEYDEKANTEIVVCETAAPARITQLARGKFAVYDLRFTADGSAVEYLTVEHVGPGYLDATCTRRTVDIATLKTTAGRVRPVAGSFSDAGLKTGVSNDGTRLTAISARNGQIRLLNAENERVVGEFLAHESWTRTIAWSHDGNRLATGATEVRVWDVDSPAIPTGP
jgi:WD40 repeat protein